MARQFIVHGNKYEVDDTIQGADFEAALDELEAHSKQKNISRFLHVLGKAEGADYGTIVGGSKFTDFSRHPGIVGLTTKEGPSTAAGKYQITATTYKEFAAKLGVKDFSPESQDRIALAIIEHEGALDLIKEGRFHEAQAKLGGRWASLPSSKYSQPKKSAEWFAKAIGEALPIASAKAEPATPVDEAAPADPGTGPYGPVPKKVDPAKLVESPDWLRASRQLFSLRNRKAFEGTDAEAAEWGKFFMGYFNSNMVDMARYARDLAANGTAEDKQAFLYLMDTYDNTEWSWEGAGRAAKGMLTDPTNLIGLGTLGIGSVGKIMASAASKQGVKKLLLESLGRTGIIAGTEGAAFGAADSTIRQGVEVTAGRRDELSLPGIAGGAALGAGAGLILGTAGDAAISAITGVIRRGGTHTAAKAPTSPVAASEAAPQGQGSLSNIDAPTAPAEQPRVTLTEQAVRAEQAGGPILTPEEVAAATARQQKGRLWVDGLPPVTPANPEAAAQLNIPSANTGLRSTPKTMDELTSEGMQIADQLRALDDKTMHGVLESFRHGALPLEESRIVARGVQLHADELRIEQASVIKQLGLTETAPEEAAKLTQRLQQVEARLVPLSLADDAFGSMFGSMLRQRQEGLPSLRGVTVESLMADNGITKEAAEGLYVRAVETAKQSADVQRITRSYESRIAAALDEGNTAEAAKLAAMQRREVAAVVEAEMPGSARFSEKVGELLISNVFTPTTVMINLIPAAIKTLALPTAKGLASDPLKAATRAEMVASYSAMQATVGAAMRAARAAYRYEQALLTRDSARLLEAPMAITGKAAGWLRFFPRVLNASDEFLGQLNYASYVSGKAAATAHEAGVANGLTGKALKESVREAIEAAMKDAFRAPTGEALIQPIVNKGHNLGLSGEALQRYVEREAMRGPEGLHGADHLRMGTNDAALSFVQDVLYKRQFSGEGTASTMAASYEGVMRKLPALKLVVGQLFFRTPVRVFEEGIRLTPGLQIIAPNFISDLAGKNGTLRQARAQAEAMVSLSIVGGILSLYASGNITGDGAYDNWKQGRTHGDGPGLPAYTIRLPDGSTWSYRNFDPVATPFKIIINGLERLDKLAIRQAQGEFVDDSAFEQGMTHVFVGLAAIGQALRDANLVTGVDQGLTFAGNLIDPEGKEGAWLKLFGERLSLLVPNTLHKIARENDPTIKDPATFWQVVEARLGSIGVDRDDVKTSYSYDVLGNVRQITDTGALWNIFSTASEQERAKGMSEDAQAVMRELDRLQRETGATFTGPSPRHPDLGGLDLRTVLAADGTETLFDRWQRNFRELTPEATLRPLLEAPLPEGTFKDQGEKVHAAQKELAALREAAFQMLMAQEDKVLQGVIDDTLNQARSRAGMNDFQRRDK